MGSIVRKRCKVNKLASLKSKLLDVTAFSFLENAWIKLFGFISFAILVRLLPRSDIGLIAIAGGYLVLLYPMQFSPHTVIFRDFEKMKSDFNKFISSYLAFWGYRSVLVMLGAGLGSIAVYLTTNNVVLSVYLIGASIVFNLNFFQGMIADVLYVTFNQRSITRLTVYANVLMLAMMALLLWYPYVLAYLVILIAWNALYSIAWWKELRKRTPFKFDLPKDHLHRSWMAFSTVSFWNHLTASVMELIYRIDTLILALFATATMVGDYSIALTIGNAFYLIPRVIQKSTILGLSQMEDKQRISELVSVMLKNGILLNAVQWIGFAIVGKYIIAIVTPTGVDEIYFLTLLIGLGVCIFNSLRAFVSLHFSKSSLQLVFWQVYFPGFLASVAYYYFFTKWFGVVGTALGNIAAFTTLSILLVAFTWRHYPIPIRWIWLSDKEKQLAKQSIEFLKRKLGFKRTN